MFGWLAWFSLQCHVGIVGADCKVSRGNNGEPRLQCFKYIRAIHLGTSPVNGLLSIGSC